MKSYSWESVQDALTANDQEWRIHRDVITIEDAIEAHESLGDEIIENEIDTMLYEK